jgi:hypothetical protein
MGQVALTPVDMQDLQVTPTKDSHHQHLSQNREFTSMSNIMIESTDINDDDCVEFIDVPTDIDMTGLDIDPEEIYQNLEKSAAS